ncbi:MAG: YabP/YqfC family sporulation protein [Clostridia bacterium]|nr:YabP/YqfC family sporulation protein [Clostridia bacterium]
MPKVKKSNPTLSPISSSFSKFRVEINKQGRIFSLICSGVSGISEFSEKNVTLKLPGFSLLIFGEGLFVTVFEQKSVEICGKISEVKISYAKN